MQYFFKWCLQNHSHWRARAPISAKPAQEEERLCSFMACHAFSDTLQKCSLCCCVQSSSLSPSSYWQPILQSSCFSPFCTLGHALMVTRQQQKYHHMYLLPLSNQHVPRPNAHDLESWYCYSDVYQSGFLQAVRARLSGSWWFIKWTDASRTSQNPTALGQTRFKLSHQAGPM